MRLNWRQFAICKIVQLTLLFLGCAVLSVSGSTSRLVQVTAAPRLKQHEQGPFLVVGDLKQTYYLLANSLHVSLSTNQVYTFTILDDASTRLFIEEPFHGIFGATLIKVQQDRTTVYDIEICELHKVKMEHKEVRIIYGLYRPAPDAPAAEVERQLFPHRREYSLGGCVADLGRKTEKRYVCSQCKLAYERWRKEQQAGNEGLRGVGSQQAAPPRQEVKNE